MGTFAIPFRRIFLFGGLAVVLVANLGACLQTSSPVSTSPREGEDNINGEQAEISLTAGEAFLFHTVVAGFNDFSIDSHFHYFPSVANPQNRQVTRPVSLMGWSLSADTGGSWEYKGKIMPPKGWSAIWGDPSVATDPASSSVIYYAQIAVSDAAWQAAYGTTNTTSGSPGADAADGFCIARSTDGGASFPDVSCKSWARRPQQADRTALIVDGRGRVWVAQNITQNNAAIDSVVFHSNATWNDFTMAPHPPRAGDSEPWLVRDSRGDIWFSAREGTGVGLQHWNGAAWDEAFDVAGQCRLTLPARDPLLGTGQALRLAHSYSLEIGPNESGVFSVRAVVAQRRTDQRQFLQAIEINSNNPGRCIVPSTWSTIDDDGQQFEPSLSFQSRAGQPWWQLVYLSTARVPNATQAYVHPEGVRVAAPTFGNTILFFLEFPTDLTPTNWFACTREDPSAPSQYWGDYVGVTQVQDANGAWLSIAGYSDSTPAPPCQAQTPYLSRPTHVRSTTW